MAGKRPSPFSSPLLRPPPELLNVKEEVETEASCWRKEVDENLKRLQSLLFGADQFLEKSDFSSAQILGLRLLGFLDSRSVTDADRDFIGPIRREVASKVDLALEGLVSDSDRKAFELAKAAPGPIFCSKGEFDVEKIKQSKHFGYHLSQYNGNGVKEMEERQDTDKLVSKAPKSMMQAKLTSLYGHSMAKPDNQRRTSMNNIDRASDECVIVERSHGFGFGTKRTHAETSSLANDGEIKADGAANGFVSAKIKLEMDARQRRGSTESPLSPQSDKNALGRGYGSRSGGLRRGYRGNFVPPVKSNGNNVGNLTSRIGGKTDDALDDSTRTCLEMLCGPDGELPEKLRNLEPRLIEHVSNEIMDRDPNVRWDDIAGLEHAKKCVTEMVIWPLLRPDIFKGCRSPGKGLLLFGPPGTGKTMIGKAIAGEAKATFFYISASSLTSKWIGEGEKLVRALFGVASCRQPAVIFVDEIDSLLSQRKSDGEHESSRRLKTQFLIEMEGFDSVSEQILLIGATNRPQELDEAARRRLTKRLYIPLPSSEARAWIIQNLLKKDGLFTLSDDDMNIICSLTEGYSGSDMKNLVKDATMGPLREALKRGIDITNLTKDDMRLVTLQDFKDALQEVRPSVSQNELGIYENWNNQFGSLSL
ncbi:PREDICTED: fidgetin-like protein 1 [Camelina sativa]|uniref:Fidgetin-like protein 1 n=1 Tax=Camelina sativa TaxID=90675 RepID=A0ABM1QGQ8_CAMSA|nr:PREDICTED: fidgetin-like protein 1 [Camelina sativa]XP_019085947.1 PREDICTED: fidgetin-like protein 1 [Camelina sativa]